MSRREKNEVHTGRLTVILLGLFLGGGITIFLALRTLITVDALFLLFLILGGLSTGIYIIIYGKKNRYIGEIIALGFLGWGFLILSTLMTINYIFHDKGSDVLLETLSIDPAEDRKGDRRIESSDSLFANFHYVLHTEELESLTYEELVQIKGLKITTAVGLFGYRVILNKELIYE